MMFALPEDLTAYQKAHLDSILKFADASSAAVEQWFDLNIKSAKAASAEALKQLRALATAKDVQELSALQTSFSQANADKLQGYAARRADLGDRDPRRAEQGRRERSHRDQQEPDRRPGQGRQVGPVGFRVRVRGRQAGHERRPIRPTTPWPRPASRSPTSPSRRVAATAGAGKKKAA